MADSSRDRAARQHQGTASGAIARQGGEASATWPGGSAAASTGGSLKGAPAAGGSTAMNNPGLVARSESASRVPGVPGPGGRTPAGWQTPLPVAGEVAVNGTRWADDVGIPRGRTGMRRCTLGWGNTWGGAVEGRQVATAAPSSSVARTVNSSDTMLVLDIEEASEEDALALIRRWKAACPGKKVYNFDSGLGLGYGYQSLKVCRELAGAVVECYFVPDEKHPFLAQVSQDWAIRMPRMRKAYADAGLPDPEIWAVFQPQYLDAKKQPTGQWLSTEDVRGIIALARHYRVKIIWWWPGGKYQVRFDARRPWVVESVAANGGGTAPGK